MNNNLKLFMVILLTVKSFFIYAQETPSENKTEAVFFDQALFRIPGKVLFYQKALSTIDSLKKLKCLKKTPLIYSSIGFQNTNLKLGSSAFEWRKNKDLTDKLVLLEKLKSFGLTGVQQDQSTIDAKLKRKNCFLKPEDKNYQNFLELVRVELFLQDRFLKNNKVDSKSLTTFIESISSKSKHEYLY